MRVAIAGASGFIGSNLITKLLSVGGIEVIALSRSNKASDFENLYWKKCDLFSVLDIEKAIKGADVVIYLVHSMQPSARLDQANFRDYDLILADNFGRAAKSLGIEKVIYLGGIIPNKEKLSPHLLSRLEVEKSLREYIPKCTIFRAGLILGAYGSSFHLLINLIKNLPVLLCPKWTKNKTSPVYIGQVVESFYSVINNDDFDNKTYDLSSKDDVTYMDLLKMTARGLGLKRAFFYINISFISFSRFWVSLFSGAPKMLAYPLVESLKHEMIPRKDRIYEEVERLATQEAINISAREAIKADYEFSKRKTKRKSVRSVQRFKTKGEYSADEAAHLYMNWLPKFLSPFILAKVDGNWITFSFLFFKLKLLVLHLSDERSTKDRQIFYIEGGILAAKQDRGRLEFREVLNKKYILVAIHDFYPALPWFIYCYSQALLHLYVMKSFGKYLKKRKKT